MPLTPRQRYLRTRAIERSYVKQVRRVYSQAWAKLQVRLPDIQTLQKVTLPADLLGELADELTEGLTDAGVLAAAEFAGMYGEEYGHFAEWEEVTGDAIHAKYDELFSDIGGYRGIASTSVQGINDTVKEWFDDPDQDLGDLTDSLSSWFAPWRAEMVGITETGRLSSAGQMVAADRLGATTWTWRTSEDDLVCDECVDLDGTEFQMEDEFPPLHPNCRCDSSLVLPGDEEYADEGGAAGDEEQPVEDGQGDGQEPE